MKISKDSSGKTTVDFMGAILPDGRRIEDLLKNRFSASLIDVLREFGIMGVVTYVGGFIILFIFPFQKEVIRQVIFAITGLFLLSLSSFISYFRIKAQRDRDKTLIEMGQGICNRLAEQIGKDMSSKYIDGIIQKIRQIINDLVRVIYYNLPGKE